LRWNSKVPQDRDDPAGSLMGDVLEDHDLAHAAKMMTRRGRVRQGGVAAGSARG